MAENKLFDNDTIFSLKEKIENLRREDSLVFPLFTDLHTDSADSESVELLCKILGTISGEISFDMAINLGDNLAASLGRKNHITTPELEDMANSLFGKIDASADCPVVFVGGNHDGIGADFFKPDFWNKLTKNKSGNKTAVYDESGSYFYIDHDKSNTRLVFLSLPSDSDISSRHPAPTWNFGSSQLRWLRDIALDTQKYVILMVHVPLFHHYWGEPSATIKVWNGESVSDAYINALCGTIEDRSEAVDIISDFARNNPHKLIIAFSGHTHRDSNLLPFEKN